MTSSHLCQLPEAKLEGRWTCPICKNKWVTTDRLSCLGLPLLLVLWGEAVPRISRQQLTGDGVKDYVRSASGWGEEKQETLRFTLNVIGPVAFLLAIIAALAS